MKKSEIKIGKRYAVKHRDLTQGEVMKAAVIQPAKAKDTFSVVLEGDEPVANRKADLTARSFIAPWDSYCVESAHDSAIAEDRDRTRKAESDAAYAAEAKRKAPYIEVFQGISVPGSAFTSSNVELPDRDLADWLEETYVERMAVGGTVRFDVFEAIAKQIADLRNALLDAGAGWDESERVDTGEPTIMQAEVNTPLAAVERLAAAIEEAEHGTPPAGVSRV